MHWYLLDDLFWYWWVVLGGVILLGFLVWGIRGRVVDGYVYCVGCDYCLEGLDGPRECVECGGDLLEAGRTYVGRRVRVWGRVFNGFLYLVLLSGIGVGVRVLPEGYKPTGWIFRGIEVNDWWEEDVDEFEDGLRELMNRYKAGKMSEGELGLLREVLLGLYSRGYFVSLDFQDFDYAYDWQSSNVSEDESFAVVSVPGFLQFLEENGEMGDRYWGRYLDKILKVEFIRTGADEVVVADGLGVGVLVDSEGFGGIVQMRDDRFLILESELVGFWVDGVKMEGIDKDEIFADEIIMCSRGRRKSFAFVKIEISDLEEGESRDLVAEVLVAGRWLGVGADEGKKFFRKRVKLRTKVRRFKDLFEVGEGDWFTWAVEGVER